MIFLVDLKQQFGGHNLNPVMRCQTFEEESAKTVLKELLDKGADLRMRILTWSNLYGGCQQQLQNQTSSQMHQYQQRCNTQKHQCRDTQQRQRTRKSIQRSLEKGSQIQYVLWQEDNSRITKLKSAVDTSQWQKDHACSVRQSEEVKKP